MSTVFNRNFNVKIDEGEGPTLQVSTTMKDMYHDFLLTMEISNQDFTIKKINLETKSRPKEDCLQLQSLAKKMEGEQITTGFIKKVTSVLGGRSGCPNLINLFLISAPLALNASAVKYQRDNNLSPEALEELWDNLMGGVCLAYPIKEE